MRSAFLTVPELAEKYKASKRQMGDAVAIWIKNGDLEEPSHFTRRFGTGYQPREFNERVVAMLIVRDRDTKNCHNAFVSGFEVLMSVLK